VSGSDRQAIEDALGTLKGLLADQNADLDDMKRATERLSIAVYKIAELMYNSTANKDFADGQ